jgi:hypothetical protein
VETTTEGLLVKLRAGARGPDNSFGLAQTRALGSFEPILDVPPGQGGFGLAPEEGATWVRITADDGAWDRAHVLLSGRFGADSAGVVGAEPDLLQQGPLPPSKDVPCQTNGPHTSWHEPPTPPDFAWHLDDAFTGLRTARDQVPRAEQERVTIVHLDTGFDPDHRTLPANLLRDQQRNFREKNKPNDARDITTEGLLRNPGHGPATLALLAGSDPGSRANPDTREPLGGAPFARIVPVRVADSVVRFTTGTIVQGFDLAAKLRADVISMSMGGLASGALADAINLCYDQGIVMVTAAGNWVDALPPTPRSIVYPARIRRVIAATGVMADGSAYWGLKGERAMLGCHGPDSKMETAVAGYTPNIPWAERGCPETVDLDGRGTSCATPQVASAAALWIAHHWDALARYPKAWMRGEAARQALFRSARKTTPKLDAAAVREMLGAGALDAAAALALEPFAEAELRAAPKASAAWDWLKLLTGTGVGLAASARTPQANLLGLEIAQLAGQLPALDAIIADPDTAQPDEPTRRRYLEALRDSNATSRTLAGAIDRALGIGTAQPRIMPAVQRHPPAPPSVTPLTRPRPTPPSVRRLNVFALDPSLGSSLRTIDSNLATVEVKFEADEHGDSILKPGPAGEYLEVVDVDPATDRFYPPVNLDDPHLLARNGLEPSEGDPQFHQQMVYAVGMRTIESFEAALGRVALWASPVRDGKRTSEFVRRLRVYPHALRAENAYYSPDKVALLLGYFPARSALSGRTAPGTIVFSCLSADIVAHEMTHALLDGFTQGYRDASNPDVIAFHEAFADVVALFQSFQLCEFVRGQIAEARGELTAASLLGAVGNQFGEGTHRTGPLRDYRRGNAALGYHKRFEPHERGALLVSGVYGAFVAIFERRTRDLIRLASGGSGLLAPGAIHADLVERLTDEAVRSARHVQRMCIRALDYCPPIDISFGTYLRAIVTADREQVGEDRLGYRTAFLETFRKLDLLPTDLRTVSVETLRWRRHPERTSLQPNRADALAKLLREAVDVLDIDWQANLPRAHIFELARARRRNLHKVMKAHFDAVPDLGVDFGLDPALGRYDSDGNPVEAAAGITFEVREVRAVQRQRPDGGIAAEILVVLAQRRPEPLYGSDPQNGWFWFRGGITVIIEPGDRSGRRGPSLRYVIAKRIGDGDRLARERAYRLGASDDGGSAYFQNGSFAAQEIFAALHARPVE